MHKLPTFFPPPRYVAHLPLRAPMTLADLCRRAGVPCRASGPWVQRPIEIAAGTELMIEAEPGYCGRVRVTVAAPQGKDPAKPKAEGEEIDTQMDQRNCRLALGALAYGLMDGVARESIRGADWSAPASVRGRPRSGRAASGRQRQRQHRLRRAAASQRQASASPI